FRPVLARALEKDPQRRTPGALQLADEFRRAWQGRPVATEIPETQFLGAPRSKPPEGGAAGWRAAGPQAPGEGAGHAQRPQPQPRGCGIPPVGATSPGSPPSAKASRRFSDELRTNPWLLLSVIVVAMALVGRSHFGRLPAVAVPVAGAYLAYWFVTRNHQNLPGNARVLGRGLGFCGERFFELVGGCRRAPANGPQLTPLTVPPGWRGGAAVDVARPPSAPPAAPRVVPAALVVSPPAKPAPAAPRPVVFTPTTLRPITLRQRLTDVTGAMTMAVFWALLATGGFAAIDNVRPVFTSGLDWLHDPGRAALFALTTILGSWAVLLPAKFSEGAGADNSRRRLIQTVLGATVGALAWWLSDVLLAPVPYSSTFSGLFRSIGRYPLLENHQASLTGFLTFFAILFGLRRWWWQADAFRSKRFRISSVILSGLVAYFIPAAFAFPQAWGVCAATTISAVVQLSAPWVPAMERQAQVEGRVA
ncbi:MAG: hypothetical protein ACT4QC_05595, partial [Planctomycetaceae bacterium]